MTTIASSTPVLRTAAASQSNSATAASDVSKSTTTADTGEAVSSSFAGGDFQTFLKMLTTQITNQDPMNPMESSDFAVQLATFSGVEQQVRTNQLLEALNAQRSEGLGSVSSWIGKEIRTTAPVALGTDPLHLAISPAEGATSVQLVALDSFGREASRQTLPATQTELTWDSRNGEGKPLPAGLYSFKLVSLKGEEIVKTDAVGAYARVTGAELTSSGIRLTLPGGAHALESQVGALREPA